MVNKVNDGVGKEDGRILIPSGHLLGKMKRENIVLPIEPAKYKGLDYIFIWKKKLLFVLLLLGFFLSKRVKKRRPKAFRFFCLFELLGI